MTLGRQRRRIEYFESTFSEKFAFSRAERVKITTASDKLSIRSI